MQTNHLQSQLIQNVVSNGEFDTSDMHTKVYVIHDVIPNFATLRVILDHR